MVVYGPYKPPVSAKTILPHFKAMGSTQDGVRCSDALFDLLMADILFPESPVSIPGRRGPPSHVSVQGGKDPRQCVPLLGESFV